MQKTKIFFFIFSLLFIPLLFSHEGFTVDSARWHLPEGASARLSKGSPADVQFSPDGTQIAVASSIGIWLYDAQTYQEIDLLTDRTRGTRSLCVFARWDGPCRWWDRWDPSLVGCRYPASYGLHSKDMSDRS